MAKKLQNEEKALRLVKIDQINDLIAESNRFIKRATAWSNRLCVDPLCFLTGCKESAATKRASMDLSRALTEIRKPV